MANDRIIPKLLLLVATLLFICNTVTFAQIAGRLHRIPYDGLGKYPEWKFGKFSGPIEVGDDALGIEVGWRRENGSIENCVLLSSFSLSDDRLITERLIPHSELADGDYEPVVETFKIGRSLDRPFLFYCVRSKNEHRFLVRWIDTETLDISSPNKIAEITLFQAMQGMGSNVPAYVLVSSYYRGAFKLESTSDERTWLLSYTGGMGLPMSRYTCWMMDENFGPLWQGDYFLPFEGVGSKVRAVLTNDRRVIVAANGKVVEGKKSANNNALFQFPDDWPKNTSESISALFILDGAAVKVVNAPDLPDTLEAQGSIQLSVQDDEITYIFAAKSKNKRVKNNYWFWGELNDAFEMSSSYSGRFDAVKYIVDPVRSLVGEGGDRFHVFRDHSNVYVLCIDVDGQLKWQSELGPFMAQFDGMDDMLDAFVREGKLVLVFYSGGTQYPDKIDQNRIRTAGTVFPYYCLLGTFDGQGKVSIHDAMMPSEGVGFSVDKNADQFKEIGRTDRFMIYSMEANGVFKNKGAIPGVLWVEFTW